MMYLPLVYIEGSTYIHAYIYCTLFDWKNYETMQWGRDNHSIHNCNYEMYDKQIEQTLLKSCEKNCVSCIKHRQQQPSF